MNDGALGELLRTIEEQADTVMQNQITICRLSRLLVEKYEVSKAELDCVVGDEHSRMSTDDLNGI